MKRIAQFFTRKPAAARRGGPANPTEREALELAHRLLSEDAAEEALSVIQSAQQAHPESPQLAELLTRLQRTVNPVLLERALDRLEHESGPELRAMIAELYRQIGDTQAAVQYGTEAILAELDNPLGYQTVGRVHLEEFRTSADTIAGMNALRYCAKAHALAPRDSYNLLQLAEIFAILRAPEAARRFLAPVQQAFAENPRVRDLDQRLARLSPENTTQIQELFLRYEREVLGDTSTCQAAVELPEGLADQLVDEAFAHPGTEGFFLVNGARRVLGGRHADGWDTAGLGNTFGLLIETAHLNCARMALGDLDWLTIQQPGSLVILARMQEGLSAIYCGAANVRQTAALQLIERLRDRVSVGGRNR